MASELQKDQELVGGGARTHNCTETDGYEAANTPSKNSGHDCLVTYYREVCNQFGIGLSAVAVTVMEVCHAMDMLLLHKTLFR